MTAIYYNEFDPAAAEWLRELMKAGAIPAGDVDERSICDVSADDLRGYRQCHFFAGIGGWPFALDLAGWGDVAVWTGSCPCPPFSSAGKKKRCPECGGKPVPHPLATGVFACVDCGHEWEADARHLWPEFRRLIEERRPAVVFGEQVAGPDGLVWFAGIRATLEAMDYGVGCADLCAPGVGAPHIRQRLFWLADDGSARKGAVCQELRQGEPESGRCGCGSERMGDTRCVGDESQRVFGNIHGEEESIGGKARQRERSRGSSGCSGEAVRLVNTDKHGRVSRKSAEEDPGHGRAAESAGGDAFRMEHSSLPAGSRLGEQHEHLSGQAADTDERMGNAAGFKQRRDALPGIHGEGIAAGGSGGVGWNPWSEFEVVSGVDGATRRVEPGTFPLAHGIPGRVGLLRGYGNAIVPELAAEFIGAFIEAREMNFNHG